MPRFHFAPEMCTLLVVDVQVDFCSPSGSTARRGKANTRMQAIPNRINAFVKEIHPLGILLVYVKSVINEARLAPNVKFFNEMKGIQRPTQEGTGGEAFCNLDIPDGAVILCKETAEPFSSTNLKEILEARHISTALICGVRTELCVDGTARRAFTEGFNVIVISDLVATRDQNTEDEAYALKYIDAYVGFVMTSEQVKHVLS
jgi:nicotinamidase-related amidase